MQALCNLNAFFCARKTSTIVNCIIHCDSTEIGKYVATWFIALIFKYINELFFFGERGWHLAVSLCTFQLKILK